MDREGDFSGGTGLQPNGEEPGREHGNGGPRETMYSLSPMLEKREGR